MARSGAALFALFLFACGGKNAPTAPRETSWPEDALRALPSDTRLVMSLDLDMARNSDIVAPLLAKAMEQDLAPLAEVEKCGFSADKLIRRIMLGIHSPGQGDDAFVVVHLAVARTLIDSCMKRLGYTVAILGPLVRYETPAGDISVNWQKADLVVTSSAGTPKAQASTGVLAPELRGILSRVNQTGFLWAAGAGMDTAIPGVESLGTEAMFLSAAGTHDLSVEATALYETEEGATSFQNSVGPKLLLASAVLPALAKVKLERHEREIRVRATLSKEDVDAVVDRVANLAGSVGGL